MFQENGNEISNIFYQILKTCQEEQEAGKLLIPLDKSYERVSWYTGYPKSVIEGVIESAQNQEFNLDTHILLMTSIKLVLQKSIEPTLDNVYKAFSNNYKLLFSKEINIPAPKFYSQINSLQYELRKTKSSSYVLMENPQVTFERHFYMSKIKKHRLDGKNIYFIDERVITNELSYIKLKSNSNIKQKEHAFFLLMSSNGYEHGLFTTVVTEDIYKRWIENIVIPRLKPCSIIVMTNCYLHENNKKSTITSYDSKKKMLQWLRHHDVPSSSSMSKAELWELIRKCVYTNEEKTVDKMFQCYGHEVLHLPSTFEEISPIEFMWEKIKTDPLLINNPNVQVANDKLYSYFMSLPPSVWSTYVSKSIQVEDEISKLDTEIEKKFDDVCDIDNNFDSNCICKTLQSLAFFKRKVSGNLMNV